jgi:hypothetical protein
MTIENNFTLLPIPPVRSASSSGGRDTRVGAGKGVRYVPLVAGAELAFANAPAGALHTASTMRYSK